MLQIIVITVFILGVVLGYFIFKILNRNITKSLDTRNQVLTALRKLDEIMMASLGLEDVAQRVTDAVAFELGFEIGVLALIDERTQSLKRVAMSRTPVGLETQKFLPIPYRQVAIPLTHKENLLVQSLDEGKMKITHDMFEIFKPTLDKYTSLRIQQTIGIKTSLVYPLSVRGKKIGVMIFSIRREERELSVYQLDMIEKLVDAMGIALDNARVYQELRDTTKQLAEANNKLRELDRLKDEFVSLASHELRTPLTAIYSYLYMVIYKSKDKLPDKTGRYLTRAYLSAGRLISLVNDMLNVSRIESGRIEINTKSFNIANLVKEVVEEVKPKATESGINLLVIDNNPPQVFADLDKIHQVLLNLIGNALKFTRPSGTVTVSFFSDGKVVETIIKDNGVGISRAEQGKLFQKFSRLDSSYLAMGTNGGTGLGLYISKRLVELMLGRLWANSEGVNKGSTFTFSLPIATQEMVTKAEHFTITPRDGQAKGLEPVAL